MPNVTEKPLVSAALGQKPSRTPIWFMRQAGRYLPEYQNIRKNIEFVDLCKTPALAAEVTIQPLRRFDLDAAILFSDILVPCMALGQEFSIDKGHGPHLFPPIRGEGDLTKLKDTVDVSELDFVAEALELIKPQLSPQQTLIGFAGAPFTVCSYMVEGGPSKDFSHLKRFMFTQKHAFNILLNKVSDLTVSYLTMQHRAGADVVMLFDSWAGNISQDDYREHIYPVMTSLFKRLKNLQIPVIYFPGQGGQQLSVCAGLEFDVLSIDWRLNFGSALKTLDSLKVPYNVQGNLDPLYLLGSEAFIREKTRNIMEQASVSARGHIFNVGHGLTPLTPIESLEWTIDEVRRFKA